MLSIVTGYYSIAGFKFQLFFEFSLLIIEKSARLLKYLCRTCYNVAVIIPLFPPPDGFTNLKAVLTLSWLSEYKLSLERMLSMSFITPQFMLRNKTAVRLYESYAKDMPIIDYHCHISPQEIYEDRRFDSITQLWLGGDHYKWRLIRSDGVPEEEITGEADPRLKFKRLAAALPKAIGNPMYHWCHLELKRYFGYDGILNADTADLVYDLANKRLAEPDMSARGIISRSNVRMIGTTDDPVDDLKWHRLLAGDSSFKTMVCPSFRPDKAINIDKPGFLEYIGLLQESAGVKIRSIQELFQALDARLDYFVENGCLATDHGLDYMVYAPSTVEQTDRIFKKALNSQPLTAEECEMYKTAVLLHLGREYAKRNIVMQIHYGVQRNANKKMFRALGPDTGFDCISTVECSSAVAGFLDALDCEGLLPKTILYSLNSADNAMLDTVTEELVKGGKVQIVGFGTFEVRSRSARQGRDPRTNEPITIAASKSPAFKAGKAFKEAVDQ